MSNQNGNGSHPNGNGTQSIDRMLPNCFDELSKRTQEVMLKERGIETESTNGNHTPKPTPKPAKDPKPPKQDFTPQELAAKQLELDSIQEQKATELTGMWTIPICGIAAEKIIKHESSCYGTLKVYMVLCGKSFLYNRKTHKLSAERIGQIAGIKQPHYVRKCLKQLAELELIEADETPINSSHKVAYTLLVEKEKDELKRRERELKKELKNND